MPKGSTATSRAGLAVLLERAKTLLASVAIVWVIVWLVVMGAVMYHGNRAPKAQPLSAVEYSLPARESSADREATE